jgi:hypothetical protein
MPYLGIAQGLVVKTGPISASDARKQKRPDVPPKATLRMLFTRFSLADLTTGFGGRATLNIAQKYGAESSRAMRRAGLTMCVCASAQMLQI